MATNKKNKKKQPQKANQQNMSPVQYFLTGRARALDMGECIINENWEESGLAIITIARKHKTGNITFSSFVVDVFCLGVKDTSQGFNRFEDEYEDYKKSMYVGMDLDPIEIDYDLAHNIIFGAVAYAAKLGFAPHKDWKYGQMILQSINAIAKMPLEFGKDGKPLYISGPHDKPNYIIDKLTKAVGAGNFDVFMNSGSLGDMSFRNLDFNMSDDDDDDDNDDDNDTQYVDYEEVKS